MYPTDIREAGVSSLRFNRQPDSPFDSEVEGPNFFQSLQFSRLIEAGKRNSKKAHNGFKGLQFAVCSSRFGSTRSSGITDRFIVVPSSAKA